MEWFHCNVCLATPPGKTSFYLSECGHILCCSCLGSKSAAGAPACAFCKAKAKMLPIGSNMSADLQELFQDVTSSINKASQAYKFQDGHASRLVELQESRYKGAEESLAAAKKKLGEAEKERQRFQDEIGRLKEENGKLLEERLRARSERMMGGGGLPHPPRHKMNIGGGGGGEGDFFQFANFDKADKNNPNDLSAFNVLSLLKGGHGGDNGDGNAGPHFGGNDVGFMPTAAPRRSGIGLGSLRIGGGGGHQRQERRLGGEPRMSVGASAGLSTVHNRSGGGGGEAGRNLRLGARDWENMSVGSVGGWNDHN